MVTALAVLIVSPKPLAWVLFVAGWALIAFPFWQNWRYGRYRPDQHQINAMSGDEYGIFMTQNFANGLSVKRVSTQPRALPVGSKETVSEDVFGSVWIALSFISRQRSR